MSHVGGTKCRKSAELIEKWLEGTAGEGDTIVPGGTKCRKSAKLMGKWKKSTACNGIPKF